MASISSALAGRSAASGPMTYRRSGVCPMYTAKFSAVPWRRTASRYSGNDSNSSHGMPTARQVGSMSSTFSIVRPNRSRSPGRVGAMLNPQLPATTVVTPW